MRSTLRKGAVTIIGASAILSLALGSTATADPHRQNNAGAPLPATSGGFLPDANDLVGTGSDTTQYVIQSASQAVSFSGGTFRDVRVASYNAIVPGSENAPVSGDPIAVVDPNQGLSGGVPTADGDETTIPRPNGSSAGVNALLNPAPAFQLLDFARSSRFRGSNTAEQNLYFIPALTDGLSYAVDKSAGTAIRNLDTAELTAIYNCTNTQGFTPYLPQLGSGTRQFFLGQLGLTDATVGACVDQSVQEHDASPVVGDPLALTPMSTARWANNPASPANPPSAVSDIAATQTTTGVFFASRTVYNVVRKADYDAAGSPLPAVFGAGGAFCTRFASGINRQGFGAAANCGALL